MSTTLASHEGPEPAETDYEEQDGEYEEYPDPSGNQAEQ